MIIFNFHSNQSLRLIKVTEKSLEAKINDFEFLDFDEPAVSHEEPGAADHCIVDRDVLFKPVL